MAPVAIILRGVQLAVALAVLAMSIAVAHRYNSETLTSAPTQVNFLIFAPLFSLISIGYLEIIPRFAPRASHPYGALAFELLNVVFYFGGFIALAVFIGQLLFCRGPVCAAAKAATAGAAFEWALWLATSVLMIKDVFKLGFRRPAAAGPPMKETV